MPITPLPQFEADLAEHLKEKADREAYERLTAPKTLVVRFGVMKMVGEFPYRGDAKPGCGSKIVVRTHRGIEMGEMLTSTCPNAGCSKSVTRKEMLEYIENSGGRDYPFHENGMALRIAGKEDMDRQGAIDSGAQELVRRARRVAESIGLPAKVVEAEALLGGERVTYYVTPAGEHDNERIDAHALQQELRRFHDCRVEVRQVGARDEARLSADYERCGQYCCCKNFLKVLKPVSMRSAKVQKATLDPLKISGRCGRLMCCLRYEDETYDELRKRLPNRKKAVGTPDGDGIVIDTQILTQLVKVRLDDTGKDIAVPVEELTEPGLQPKKKKPEPKPRSDRSRGEASSAPSKPKRKRRKPGVEAPSSGETSSGGPGDGGSDVDRIMSDLGLGGGSGSSPGEAAPKKKKRRRRKKPTGDSSSTGDGPDRSGEPSAGAGGNEAGSKKKRRRRRRKPGGGGGGGDGAAGGSGGDSGGGR